MTPHARVDHESTRVGFADAGHMIPWDDEAGFYAAFGDFLGTPLTID